LNKKIIKLNERVSFYRLNDCTVRHKTSRYIPSVQTHPSQRPNKISRYLSLRDNSYLVGAQTESWSGDFGTPTTQWMNRWMASWSSYLAVYWYQN